jgi:DNA mismatch repair protein MSH6
MAKSEDITEGTPVRPSPAVRKQNSSAASNKNQRSILGFFSKAAPSGTPSTANGTPKANGLSANSNGNAKLPSSSKSASAKTKAQNITPLPSSDSASIPSSQENIANRASDEVDNGLPSPLTPAKSYTKQAVNGNYLADFSSPSRRVCPQFSKLKAKANHVIGQAKKAISYAESADEDDEGDAIAPSKISKQRRNNSQRRPIFDDDDDEDDNDGVFSLPGLDGAADEDDEG